MNHINFHLMNDILQDVLREKSTAALWLNLKQLCMKKSLPIKFHLKQPLYSHRLTEGMSVIDHISTFKKIVVDLDTMEVKYDEKDSGLIFFCVHCLPCTRILEILFVWS